MLVAHTTWELPIRQKFVSMDYQNPTQELTVVKYTLRPKDNPDPDAQ